MAVDRRKERELEMEAEAEAEAEEAEKEKEEGGEGEENEDPEPERPMAKARKALEDDKPVKTKPEPNDDDLVVGTISMEDLNGAMAYHAEEGAKKAIAPLLVQIESLVAKNVKLQKAITSLIDGVDELAEQNVVLKKAITTGSKSAPVPGTGAVEAEPTPKRTEKVEEIQKAVTANTGDPEISYTEQERLIDEAESLRQKGIEVEGYNGGAFVARWGENSVKPAEFVALKKAIATAKL